MTAGTGTVDRRDERIGVAATVTAAFGAAAVLAQQAGVHVVCPLRALTGVPCPGCGMTTVASSLARGDVSGALATDPAGVVLVVVVAALAVVHLGGRRWPALDRALPADCAMLLAGGVALVVHWSTTLLTG